MCKGENCPNPHCPVCGECDGVEWMPCPECEGNATIECACEGMGGNLFCGYGCDGELKPANDDDREMGGDDLIQYQLSIKGV